MKGLKKLKQRLIAFVHVESGSWLKKKGLIIQPTVLPTGAQKVLPTVDRTKIQKILDETNYRIDRNIAGKPMPELRVTREAKDKNGKVYWMGFGWWYPSDWDFEIGGKEN
jgi:hypothetical protein